MSIQSVRGVVDILPEGAGIWQFVEQKFRRVCRLYGFQEIRTPAFESTELFTKSIGEATDIVSKEMYTFPDRKGRSLTLRPEGTAPVVRAALEHSLIGGQESLAKLYYIGPMFRYERPQAGRQRQFHQVGVEFFGPAGPLADVETIDLAIAFLKSIGLGSLSLQLSSVGCAVCRPEFRKKLGAYFAKHIQSMCADCQRRLTQNPMRILDCKEESCQKPIASAPSSLDSLCTDCKTHLTAVENGLKTLGIVYELNRRLVRGLDYYTRTTFEITSNVLGAQNAVCGGGRYDNLVAQFGGKPTPAVGFAMGVERLIETLKGLKVHEAAHKNTLKIFLAIQGDAAQTEGLKLLQGLREAGIASETDYQDKSLKSQFKQADRIKASHVVIIGEQEIEKGMAGLKDLSTGQQAEIPLASVAEKLVEIKKMKGCCSQSPC